MKTICCLLVLTAAGAAQAQTVWRCGADGRSYGDSPCPQGRVVTVADVRNSADRQAAAALAAREQALATSLVQARQVRAAAHTREVGSGLAGIGPLGPAPVNAKLKGKGKEKARTPQVPRWFEARGTSPAVAQASR